MSISQKVSGTGPGPSTSSLHGAVWMASLDRQLLYCSPGVEDLVGSKVEDLRGGGELWCDHVHPDDRQLAERAFDQVLADGEARATYRLVRADGDECWVEDHRVRCEDGPSSAAFVGGVLHDVTSMVRCRQIRHLQQSFVRAIADGDSGHRILVELCRHLETIVSDAVATILLLDGERTLRVAAAPGSSPELVEAIDGLVPGDNVGSCGTAAYTGTACFVTDTSTDPRWASMQDAARALGIRSCWSLPILLRGQCVVRTIAISSFVRRAPTEFHAELLETAAGFASIVLQQERDRQDLMDALDSAEAATRAKSDLLANVSHELRTPLTAILGFTELMLDEPEKVGPFREDLGVVFENGKHLLQLVNDLLDVSKVEAGELKVEPRPTSIREILEDALRTFEPSIREQSLTLRVENLDELPEQVITDPTRLRQVLVNLVSNAIKFTREGEIAVSCRRIASDEGTTSLRISVADTGIGMSQEQIDQVFTPFRQADPSTTRLFGGTGLGLSLSLQLARLLGGEITVESVVNQGSTFTFVFTANLPDESPH